MRKVATGLASWIGHVSWVSAAKELTEAPGNTCNTLVAVAIGDLEATDACEFLPVTHLPANTQFVTVAIG